MPATHPDARTAPAVRAEVARSRIFLCQRLEKQTRPGQPALSPH